MSLHLSCCITYCKNLSTCTIKLSLSFVAIVLYVVIIDMTFLVGLFPVYATICIKNHEQRPIDHVHNCLNYEEILFWRVELSHYRALRRRVVAQLSAHSLPEAPTCRHVAGIDRTNLSAMPTAKSFCSQQYIPGALSTPPHAAETLRPSQKHPRHFTSATPYKLRS